MSASLTIDMNSATRYTFRKNGVEVAHVRYRFEDEEGKDEEVEVWGLYLPNEKGEYVIGSYWAATNLQGLFEHLYHTFNV
mgnify:CR=1 FL=1